MDFLRLRYSIPEGWKIKKRIERVWNGHGADSEIGNVSARQAALNRWMATDKRWNRKLVSWGSVVTSVERLPIWATNSWALTLIDEFIYLFICLLMDGWMDHLIDSLIHWFIDSLIDWCVVDAAENTWQWTWPADATESTIAGETVGHAGLGV